MHGWSQKDVSSSVPQQSAAHYFPPPSVDTHSIVPSNPTRTVPVYAPAAPTGPRRENLRRVCTNEAAGWGGRSAFACALRQGRWQMAQLAGGGARAPRGRGPPHERNSARAAPASSSSQPIGKPKATSPPPSARSDHSPRTVSSVRPANTATGQSAGLAAWIRIALYHYHPRPNLALARRTPHHLRRQHSTGPASRAKTARRALTTAESSSMDLYFEPWLKKGGRNHGREAWWVVRNKDKHIALLAMFAMPFFTNQGGKSGPTVAFYSSYRNMFWTSLAYSPTTLLSKVAVRIWISEPPQVRPVKIAIPDQARRRRHRRCAPRPISHAHSHRRTVARGGPARRPERRGPRAPATHQAHSHRR